MIFSAAYLMFEYFPAPCAPLRCSPPCARRTADVARTNRQNTQSVDSLPRRYHLRLAVSFARVLTQAFGYSLTEEVVRCAHRTITQLVQHVLTKVSVCCDRRVDSNFPIPESCISQRDYARARYTLLSFPVGACVLQFRASKKMNQRKCGESLWLIALAAIIMLLLGGVPYWVTNLPVTLGFPPTARCYRSCSARVFPDRADPFPFASNILSLSSSSRFRRAVISLVGGFFT